MGSGITPISQLKMTRSVVVEMRFLVLFLVCLICFSGVSSASNAEITAFSNNYTNDSDIMFNCTQSTIQFNISVVDTANITWYVDKINQTTNFGGSLFNYSISDTNIHEIRAETNNGTYTDVVEWVVANKSLSDAPIVFDFFTDGKYDNRAILDPWNRELPEWDLKDGSFNNDSFFVTVKESSYNSMETPSNILFGTWKFNIRLHEGIDGYNDAIGFYPIANDSWDGSDYTRNAYRFLKPSDEHLWFDSFNSEGNRNTIAFNTPDQTGSNYYPISTIGTGWHNVTIVHNDNTEWQIWIDGEFVPFSNKRVNDILISTAIALTMNAPNMQISFDSLEIYEDEFLYPSNSASFSNNRIYLSGYNNTLESINSDINNAELFEYNQSTRTAISYKNITLLAGANLNMVNSTLHLNSTSSVVFELLHGYSIFMDASTITTNTSQIEASEVDTIINGNSISGYRYGTLIITNNSLINNITRFISGERYVYIDSSTINLTGNHGYRKNFNLYSDYISIINTTLYRISGGTPLSSISGWFYNSILNADMVASGATSFVNTVVNSGTISQYKLQTLKYQYYTDIYVVNSASSPLNNIKIIIASNDSSQLSETNNMNYVQTWTLDGSNYYQKMSINKTMIETITSLNGHTPLPNETNSIVLTDYWQYKNTSDNFDPFLYKYFTYTITATKDETGIKTLTPTSSNVQYTNLTNSTTVELDETWLRSNPNTYQNTTTLTMIKQTELFNVVIS